MNPSDPASDKLVERARYDERAGALLASGNLADLGGDGAAGVPVELRAPYLAYEAQIRRVAAPGRRVLDVCCGNGLHSLVAAACGAAVTVSDIAPHNVALAIRRAERAGQRVEGVVADAEHLPCDAASFDVVTCAGSLSYVDLELFLREVRRILRAGGRFVCVDSLNHNPLYRFNRYRRYRRGERSLSAIRRIPTVATIARLRAAFPAGAEVGYFGIAAGAAPLLRPLVGAARTARIVDRFDRLLPGLRRYAFKFVFAGGTEERPR